MFVAIERYGLFHRVLTPGVHFLWHPFDQMRAPTWSYTNQHGENCHVTDCFVSSDLQQMDTPPIKCVSRETTPIEVDATIMYRVTDLPRALYEVHDGLNYFYQCVLQATRDVCASLTVPELQGHDNTISDRITEYTNRFMGEGNDFKGIKCIKVVVQSISLSPEVLNERKKRYEAEEEHRRKMDLLKHDEIMQKRHHALLLEQTKAEAEREYARHTQMVKPYIDQGFTPDQYVALKSAEALSNVKRLNAYFGNAPGMFWVTQNQK